MAEPKRRLFTVHKANYKGWRFQYELYEGIGEFKIPGQKEPLRVGKNHVPTGGIILRNIFHDDFRLAYDIGVVGIYVFPNEAGIKANKYPKMLVLGPPHFQQLENSGMPITVGKATPPFVQPSTQSSFDTMGLNKGVYDKQIECELKVTFISIEEVFGEGSGHLVVEQKFFFCCYDNNPSHEPGARLKAARVHPITRIQYRRPKKNNYVKSFRVDYRLRLNLNAWFDKEKGKKQLTRNIDPTSGPTSNAAGVFRDDDDTDTTNIFRDGVKDVVFQSAEKPLMYEIIADGLNSPKKTNQQKSNITWDNIHWWGVGNQKVYGSTPGSFHAAHIHWRWGKEIQQDSAVVSAKDAGKPQYSSLLPDGSLVDFKAGKQIIRFAIVKNHSKFYQSGYSSLFPNALYQYNYAALEALNKIFGFFFYKDQYDPQNIDKGGDLILFYSAEIEVYDIDDYWNPIGGLLNVSFFTHGLFFAHDLEPPYDPLDILTGDTKSFYKNPAIPPKQWNRQPTS